MLSWTHKENRLYYACKRSLGKGTSKSRKPIAYMSFKLRYHYHNDKSYVVVRARYVHSGHTPGDEGDKHLNNICLELKAKLFDYIKLGVKPDMILVHAHKWAQSNGHTDLHDRAFYVTPDDIANLTKQWRNKQQLHPNDSQSTHALLNPENGKFKDSTIYYQEWTPDQPFIAVLQDGSMYKDMLEQCRSICFFEAMHQVLAKDFVFSVILNKKYSF